MLYQISISAGTKPILAIRGTFAAAPAKLTAEIAHKLCRELSEKYVAAPRMIRFYRRLWRVLRLGAVWPAAPVKTLLARERYRRLTFAEVRLHVRTLTGKNQTLSDLITIGYSTGLRLSDAKELERSEISPTVDAISGHRGGGMHARYTQPSLATLRAAVERAIPPLAPIYDIISANHFSL